MASPQPDGWPHGVGGAEFLQRNRFLWRPERSSVPAMQIHASCAAREGAGVLLLGAPGAGKSDLLLRLLDRGFRLVADDRVEVRKGIARPAPALAGLLEVRGLGILRLPHEAEARLVLAVSLDRPPGGHDRLPHPARHLTLDLPLVTLDPALASAAQRVALALDCALGHLAQVAGAFGGGSD